MSGDDKRRHCARCDRLVHDLCGLTQAEARRLAATGICGQYVADREGTPLFADRTILAPLVAAVMTFGCTAALESGELESTEAQAGNVSSRSVEIPDADGTTTPPPVGADATHSHDHEGECDERPNALRGIIVPNDAIVINEKIYFPSSVVDIQPRSQRLLDEIVKVLLEIETVDVVLEGHSDGLESSDAGVDVAQGRARAVYEYLVAKGIASDRLSVVGRGADLPLADNATEAGRARNRRVEFHVVNPPADGT